MFEGSLTCGTTNTSGGASCSGVSVNNGNLQCASYNNAGTVFNQAYSYDMGNRLMTTFDSGGWWQAFNYDQYGNMYMRGGANQGSGGLPVYPPMPTSNIYNSANQNPNLTYDAAGNQTGFGSITLTYDAENRQTSATYIPSGQSCTQTDNSCWTGWYVYDGLGQRVEKILDSQSTVYVYDAFGMLISEYSDEEGAAPACSSCYLSYDHLGTVRMVTDQSASVVARHDFTPFGQEIPGDGSVGRNSQWGSTTDVEPKFTGQIRDQETGLDFFNARYFFGQLQRFMSPDPANAGADMTDPHGRNSPVGRSKAAGSESLSTVHRRIVGKAVPDNLAPGVDG